MKIRKPNFFEIYGQKNGEEVVLIEEAQTHDVSVDIVMNQEEICVSAKAEKTPLYYLHFRWNFTEAEKRRDTVKVLGDEWERGYGTMEWHGISPARSMPWVCMVSNGSDACADVSGRHTECFGVKTSPGGLCFWRYDPRGISLWVDVRCGGSGVILGGRTLEVCRILFADYYDMLAFDACCAYYSRLCDHLLMPDYKVYGANNYYFTYGVSSQMEVLDSARELRDRCQGIENRPYYVIDDGWQKINLSAPWESNERFPDMKELAGKIREMDIKPGIWVRPLYDVEFSIFPEGSPMRMPIHKGKMLDPSHPQVLDFVGKTIRTFVHEWDYELIKYDFTCIDMLGYWGFQRKDSIAANGWHFYDTSKTTAEIFTQLYSTIYQQTKGKALLLGCNVPTHLAAGYVHINRIGDDTSGKDWERNRNYGINSVAFRMMHHGALYAADADVVAITEHVDWNLNRQWLELLTYSGTPLFVSPKPALLNDEQEMILRESYRINVTKDHSMRPVDWMENVCPSRWMIDGELKEFQWYPEQGTMLTF